MRTQFSLFRLIVVTLVAMILLLLGPGASLAAPPNDNFADAETIGGLPFEVQADVFEATREAGEPTTASDCFSADQTIWYSFTPSFTGSISAQAYSPYGSTIAIYTGSSLADLQSLGCGHFGNFITFHVEAGTTYYFQIASGFDNTTEYIANVNIYQTPPPDVYFYYDPSQPSVYDTIQFYDSSYGGYDTYIISCVWNFGDGTTASDCYPTHKYAADGDYEVQLTVTTNDGRTGSASQVVQVRTRDVAITKFNAPKTGKAGQTQKLSVGVVSKSAEEVVRVELLKSIPGGFQTVGTLTLTVPERSTNRTTNFAFSYTFTNEDAALGKVTFKAVATFEDGGPDALPGDNEAIAPPTKVN